MRSNSLDEPRVRITVNDEDSPVRSLKQTWEEEDGARDKREERAQQIFLEEEANHAFAPKKDRSFKLPNVLLDHVPFFEGLDDPRNAVAGNGGSAPNREINFSLDNTSNFSIAIPNVSVESSDARKGPVAVEQLKMLSAATGDAELTQP